MLRVSRWTFGKFARYVAQIVLSYSLANTVLKPAFSKPRSKPPAPENKEITRILNRIAATVKESILPDGSEGTADTIHDRGKICKF